MLRHTSSLEHSARTRGARRLLHTGDIHGVLEALDTPSGPSPGDGAPPSATNWTGEECVLRGWAFLALGDLDAALAQFWEAGTGADAAANVALRVEMLNGYAQCLVAGDPIAPARGVAAEATVRSRKMGRADLLALTLRTRGTIAMDRCRFDEAEAWFTESLVHARAGHDLREESAGEEQLAVLLRWSGRVAAASRLAGEAVAAAAAAGDRRGHALAAWTHASCLAALGDVPGSRALRAGAEEELDALRLPRPRGAAPETWHRLYLESRSGRATDAADRARLGLHALLAHPPLLAEHAVPASIVDLRAAAAAHFARLLDDRSLDLDALRAADREALMPVDDADPAVQRARRARVEAQMHLLRADRRALLMGLEVPAGARAAARDAVDAAWLAERAARATSRA